MKIKINMKNLNILNLILNHNLNFLKLINFLNINLS